MREHLGKGASGDLSATPLAELIAEAYRHELTGSLSMDQAGGTSRIYMRGGLIAGAQVYAGFKPLGQLLLELGWIDIDALDRSLMEVARGKKQGAALIELGIITQEQLVSALDIQLRRNLAMLLALRAGKWHWSDESPPAWTRDLTLDPVRLLADEFEAGLGTLPPEKVLARHLGAQRLVLSRRGVQWLGAEFMEGADLALHQRLQAPLTLGELADDTGLIESRAQAVAAALLLCGCARAEHEGEAPEAALQPGEIMDTPEAHGEVGLALSASHSVHVEEAAQAIYAVDASGDSGAVVEQLPLSAIVADDAASGSEALLARELPPEPPPPPPKPIGKGVDDATVHNVRSRLLARAFQNLGMAPKAPAPPPPPPPPPPPKPVSAPLGDAPQGSMPGIARGQKLLPEERLMIAQIEEVHERILQEDYFQRLHVNRDATGNQLKKAFFERAMRFHPDRATGALAPLGTKMKEIFTALNEAHETLSDTHRRAEYVRQLAIAQQKASGDDPEKKEAAKSIFQKGQIQLRRRDYTAAEQLFRQAAELHPGRGNYKAYEAWSILVDPLRPKSDREKVRELLKIALTDKRADHAHYVAGVLARLEEKWVDAERHFQSAVELNEKNIEAVRELKFVRVKLEKDQASGSFLNRLRGR